ncbi:hypothetical protein GCM10027064_26620 [Microbacterium petrolearium]
MHSRLLVQADTDGKIDSSVSVDATNYRAHQHGTNTTSPERATEGGLGLHEPPRRVRPQPVGGECEPAGHCIGRSRGGLSTKIHHAVDGCE